MKKGLVGCLVVGVLLIAVGSWLAWSYVLKPMFGAGQAVAEGARDWAQVLDAEQAITNQSPFTAPVDGRLTQDQVNDFVAVQANLQLRLGADFEVLRRKHEELRAAQGAGNSPGVGDIAALAPELAKLVARAREAQVEGLNARGLSLAEYRWIREQANAALPFLDLDPDAIVAPRPPEGAAVDAATGEIIELPPEEPLEAVDAMAADADAAAAPAAPEDSGLEYAGTAPADIDEVQLDEKGMPTTLPRKPGSPPKGADPIAALGTVADRGLGDDRELDDPATQAARANAVLLRPYKDLLLATLGTSWAGL
jgi:hypothetical protein